MSIYYIYAYVRLDGTPYYIGKGTGNRAFSKHHRVSVPKDKSRIVIMENNLTEVGALALERFYIRWYGRKDIRTGILHNMTDGGEGSSGAILSEETKAKMSFVRKGRTLSDEHRKKVSNALVGRSFSSEHKNKCKIAKSGKNNPMYGRKQSKEARLKIAESNRRRKLSDETKRKISETKRMKRLQNFGSTVSKETMENIKAIDKNIQTAIMNAHKMWCD